MLRAASGRWEKSLPLRDHACSLPKGTVRCLLRRMVSAMRRIPRMCCRVANAGRQMLHQFVRQEFPPPPPRSHRRFDRLVVVTQPWAFVLGILSPGRDIAARKKRRRNHPPLLQRWQQKCQPVCLILFLGCLGSFWVGRSRQIDPPTAQHLDFLCDRVYWNCTAERARTLKIDTSTAPRCSIITI